MLARASRPLLLGDNFGTPCLIRGCIQSNKTILAVTCFYVALDGYLNYAELGIAVNGYLNYAEVGIAV